MGVGYRGWLQGWPLAGVKMVGRVFSTSAGPRTHRAKI
jgi:hypothetical protein